MDIEKQGKAINEINASPEAIEAELAEILEGVGTGSPSETEQKDIAPIEGADRDRYARRLTGMLTMPVVALFGVFAPAWKITTSEGEKLTFAWARVAAKYAPTSWLYWVPDSGGSGGCVECDAIACTIEVVAPRVIGAREEKEQRGGIKETARPQQDAMPDVFGAAH